MKTRADRKVFSPRVIDRAVFAILSGLHIVNGVYLIGPWYLDETDNTKAPLVSMFSSTAAVVVYGAVLLVDGLLLAYAAAGKQGPLHTSVTDGALIAGFLMRLYALIGVFLVATSWRPPSYLSHIATVFLLGAYWVWVRVSVKSSE